jgi:aspartyl-tRNA(Asn)/glutamyl-tRNA(Gln) amidotransferase subunit B
VGSIPEDELPKYKVEVKNINSFNFVKKAIEYEVKRHIALLEAGTIPPQETRGWNEDKNETFSQRRKETADDYRYFPDPDIPPLRFTKEYIEEIKKTIPELPDAKYDRFIKQYSLTEQDAEQLSESKERADFFELVAEKVAKSHISAKKAANYLINKKAVIGQLSPDEVVKELIASLAVATVSVDELEKIIDRVLHENEKAVADYKAGKEQSIMFLLGCVMRTLGKKVDSQMVIATIKSRLR